MAVKYLTVTHIQRKEVPGLSLNDIRRLFSKIHIDAAVQHNGVPCWIWMGAGYQSKAGSYGQAMLRNKLRATHRIMYAWLVAPIPAGGRNGVLDHLCRRTLCCNPVHLELVPHRTNILRGHSPIAKQFRQTECKYGHPFTPENTIIITKAGARNCRTCSTRIWQKRQGDPAYRARKREQARARKRNAIHG